MPFLVFFILNFLVFKLKINLIIFHVCLSAFSFSGVAKLTSLLFSVFPPYTGSNPLYA